MADPVETWVEAVRDAERRGELLSAFDLAERGLAEHPDDVWLRHRAVLALARAGSTEEALKRFEDHGLASVNTEDVRALRARIAKDIALSAEGAEATREAAAAASLYRAIFEVTGGYYPGINAATLTLLAGDSEEARRLALRVLDVLSSEDPGSYYVAATEAEALLVLGREAQAREALARAAATHGGDFGALASTRRQLRLVCEAAGIDPVVLSGCCLPLRRDHREHRVPGQGWFIVPRLYGPLQPKRLELRLFGRSQRLSPLAKRVGHSAGNWYFSTMPKGEVEGRVNVRGRVDGRTLGGDARHETVLKTRQDLLKRLGRQQTESGYEGIDASPSIGTGSLIEHYGAV